MIIELKNCRTPACVAAGDTKHRVDWDGLTLQECRKLQKTMGWSPGEWQDALSAGATGPHGVEAMLMWGLMVHSRLGIQVGFEEIDFMPDDLDFLPEPVAEPEGKETPTSPRPDGDPSSTSGTSTGEGSTARSSTTQPTSGGGSDSL